MTRPAHGTRAVVVAGVVLLLVTAHGLGTTLAGWRAATTVSATVAATIPPPWTITTCTNGNPGTLAWPSYPNSPAPTGFKLYWGVAGASDPLPNALISTTLTQAQITSGNTSTTGVTAAIESGVLKIRPRQLVGNNGDNYRVQIALVYADGSEGRRSQLRTVGINADGSSRCG